MCGDPCATHQRGVAHFADPTTLFPSIRQRTAGNNTTKAATMTSTVPFASSRYSVAYTSDDIT